ncbi:MAG: two-component system, NarL family, response regulator NreC [Gaiellales bacterium]|nr:two-component system, NarL family, response regulator NreC [Gaiellales bacterium]
METITILVADYHAIVRAGIRLLLDEEPDLTVVGEAGDGDEAIAKALELAPDVVLLDVMMPNTNGLDAARRISRETSCRILMLSMQDDPGYVRRAFANGASGYILKEVAHSQLVSAVRCVAAGEEYVDGDLAARLAAEGIGDAVEDARPLSEREQEVLDLLALGYTNKEIACRLDISVRTAETHRANVMQKLSLRTRAELVRHAIATGRLKTAAAAS